MNIEVEIKIKVNNFDEIKEKVSKLGKLIKSIHQIDEYYIPFHKDYFAVKPHPVEYLRIRTNPDKIVFEYTKAINRRESGDYDYAEEYETPISDPVEFRKILDFLDFKKVVTVDKQREYWDCGNIEVALDKVKDLGEFIEAEAKGDFNDFKEARKVCIEFLESIGISNPTDIQVKMGYPQLLIEKDHKLE